MTIINERKLNELERNVYTINVITKLSRFYLNEENQKEVNKRFEYILSMYLSLEKYQDLYDSTGNNEYKNFLENNFDSAVECINEQKEQLHGYFSLSTLLFLENIKKMNREGFIKEISLIIDQFNTSKDVSEYISYHGSLDLNNMINSVLTFNILPNYRNLFETIKNERIITYKKDEWISISNKLNSCLLDLKLKEPNKKEIDNLIDKLSAYRFLLVTFDYVV